MPEPVTPPAAEEPKVETPAPAADPGKTIEQLQADLAKANQERDQYKQERDRFEQTNREQAHNFKKLRDMTKEEKEVLTKEQLEVIQRQEKIEEDQETLRKQQEDFQKDQHMTKRDNLIKEIVGSDPQVKELILKKYDSFSYDDSNEAGMRQRIEESLAIIKATQPDLLNAAVGGRGSTSANSNVTGGFADTSEGTELMKKMGVTPTK